MASPAVRIRMYRQRFGDCFLLRFARPNGAPDFNVLIDCGLITGGTNPDLIRKYAQNIADTTNHHLNLVVGTHEHWDHLSGFNQAKSIFDGITIDNVWLAWTENPANTVAKSLVKERAVKVTALRGAVEQMAGLTGAADHMAKIGQVLGFFPPLEATNGSIGSGAVSTGLTGTCMNYLRTLPKARVHYCDPHIDPPLTLEGVDNVRAYVFGPPSPKDANDKQWLSYIKMTDPSSKATTYGVKSASAEDSFYAALRRLSPEAKVESADELANPFEAELRIPMGEARKLEFFNDNYGFLDGDPNLWRRIDNDWMDIASELALALDSDTNNTSLVLAFELGEPGSGDVLLFAADAQVGNWYSWKDLAWNITPPGKAGMTVTPNQLLSRAIFYKVGHHGSHNATLRINGLEAMTGDNLVAMLPVDKDIAHNVKHWNQMPFDPLLETLGVHTKGRILRIDTGMPADKPGDENSHLSDEDWDAFTKAVTLTDDYIEYKIEGKA
jgi:hypothetical protein